MKMQDFYCLQINQWSGVNNAVLYHSVFMLWDSPFILFVMACAGYAYLVDARRPADDPQKRNYHPVAIVFAPLTLPIFVVLSISIFMLRVLLYGVVLILLPILLITARKPFLLL